MMMGKESEMFRRMGNGEMNLPEESHQGDSNKTDGCLRMGFGFGLMRIL